MLIYFDIFSYFCILETVQLIENDPQNTGKLAEISNTFTNNIGKTKIIFVLFLVLLLQLSILWIIWMLILISFIVLCFLLLWNSFMAKFFSFGYPVSYNRTTNLFTIFFLFLFLHFSNPLLHYTTLFLWRFVGSISVKSNTKKSSDKDTHTLPLPTSLFWSKISQTFATALSDQINPADLELLDSVLSEEVIIDENNEKKEKESHESENENGNKNVIKDSIKVWYYNVSWYFIMQYTVTWHISICIFSLFLLLRIINIGYIFSFMYLLIQNILSYYAEFYHHSYICL